jgi:hypothetical protein
VVERLDPVLEGLPVHVTGLDRQVVLDMLPCWVFQRPGGDLAARVGGIAKRPSSSKP